jgi:protein SCO1
MSLDRFFAQLRLRAAALLAAQPQRRMVLVTGAAAVCMVALLGALVASGRAETSQPTRPAVPSIFQAGGADLGGIPAPNFSLKDQNGATVTLDQFRGRVVVLTFFDSICPHADCSLMAQYINVTGRDLGAQSSQFGWVAISVNPWHDTPDSASAFLHSRQVTLPLHYLLGSPDQLAPVWKDYHMQAILQSDGVVIHTTGVYVIDATGRERAFLEEGFDPAALSAYLQQLRTQSGVAPVGSAAATPAGTPNGTVIQSQRVGGQTVALTASPAAFGTYTFTVTVEDAQGVPVQGAHVTMDLAMPDMAMAPVKVTLSPLSPPVPGTYQAQGVLSMVGRWQAVVTVSPAGGSPFAATFVFTARY